MERKRHSRVQLGRYATCGRNCPDNCEDERATSCHMNFGSPGVSQVDSIQLRRISENSGRDDGGSFPLERITGAYHFCDAISGANIPARPPVCVLVLLAEPPNTTLSSSTCDKYKELKLFSSIASSENQNMTILVAFGRGPPASTARESFHQNMGGLLAGMENRACLGSQLNRLADSKYNPILVMFERSRVKLPPVFNSTGFGEPSGRNWERRICEVVLLRNCVDLIGVQWASRQFINQDGSPSSQQTPSLARDESKLSLEISKLCGLEAFADSLHTSSFQVTSSIDGEGASGPHRVTILSRLEWRISENNDPSSPSSWVANKVRTKSKIAKDRHTDGRGSRLHSPSNFGGTRQASEAQCDKIANKIETNAIGSSPGSGGLSGAGLGAAQFTRREMCRPTRLDRARKRASCHASVVSVIFAWIYLVADRSLADQTTTKTLHINRREYPYHSKPWRTDNEHHLSTPAFSTGDENASTLGGTSDTDDHTDNNDDATSQLLRQHIPDPSRPRVVVDAGRKIQNREHSMNPKKRATAYHYFYVSLASVVANAQSPPSDVGQSQTKANQTREGGRANRAMGPSNRAQSPATRNGVSCARCLGLIEDRHHSCGRRDCVFPQYALRIIFCLEKHNSGHKSASSSSSSKQRDLPAIGPSTELSDKAFTCCCCCCCSFPIGRANNERPHFGSRPICAVNLVCVRLIGTWIEVQKQSFEFEREPRIGSIESRNRSSPLPMEKVKLVFERNMQKNMLKHIKTPKRSDLQSLPEPKPTASHQLHIERRVLIERCRRLLNQGDNQSPFGIDDDSEWAQPARVSSNCFDCCLEPELHFQDDRQIWLKVAPQSQLQDDVAVVIVLDEATSRRGCSKRGRAERSQDLGGERANSAPTRSCCRHSKFSKDKIRGKEAPLEALVADFEQGSLHHDRRPQRGRATSKLRPAGAFELTRVATSIGEPDEGSTTRLQLQSIEGRDVSEIANRDYDGRAYGRDGLNDNFSKIVYVSPRRGSNDGQPQSFMVDPAEREVREKRERRTKQQNSRVKFNRSRPDISISSAEAAKSRGFNCTGDSRSEASLCSSLSLSRSAHCAWLPREAIVWCAHSDFGSPKKAAAAAVPTQTKRQKRLHQTRSNYNIGFNNQATRSLVVAQSEEREKRALLILEDQLRSEVARFEFRTRRAANETGATQTTKRQRGSNESVTSHHAPDSSSSSLFMFNEELIELLARFYGRTEEIQDKIDRYLAQRLDHARQQYSLNRTNSQQTSNNQASPPDLSNPISTNVVAATSNFKSLIFGHQASSDQNNNKDNGNRNRNRNRNRNDCTSNSTSTLINTQNSLKNQRRHQKLQVPRQTIHQYSQKISFISRFIAFHQPKIYERLKMHFGADDDSLLKWLRVNQEQYSTLKNISIELIAEPPSRAINVCLDGPKIWIYRRLESNRTLNDIFYCYTPDQWIEKLWLDWRPSPYHFPLLALNILIFLFGFTGNIFVCLSVYRNHQLRNVTNYHIVNLAIADLLVIIICLPATSIWDVSLTWFFGTIACKLIMYLQDVSISVSVLTLAAISIDRYYAICYPLRFKSSLSKAKRVICLIWLLSLTIMLPDLIYLAATQSLELSEAGLNTVLYSDCNYKWSEQSSQLFQYVKTILLYVIPFVFMFVAHFRIMKALKISTTATATTTMTTPALSNANPAPSAAHQQAAPVATCETYKTHIEQGDAEQDIKADARFRDNFQASGLTQVASELHASNQRAGLGGGVISAKPNPFEILGEIAHQMAESSIEIAILRENDDTREQISKNLGLNAHNGKIEAKQPCDNDADVRNTLKNLHEPINQDRSRSRNNNDEICGLERQQAGCPAGRRRQSWFAAATTNVITKANQRNDNDGDNNTFDVINQRGNNKLSTKKSQSVFNLKRNSLIGTELIEQSADDVSMAQMIRQQHRSQPDWVGRNSFCVAMHNKSQLESRRNAAKMLMAIVIFFGLTHLPVHLMNFLRHFIEDIPQNDFTLTLSMVAHSLCHLNSAINPILYNYMNSVFRTEFRKSLSCLLCSCKQQQHLRGENEQAMPRNSVVPADARKRCASLKPNQQDHEAAAAAATKSNTRLKA